MRVLIAAPLLLLLVLFALSNSQPVRVGLWPTDLSLEPPLSIAVLAGMAIAFLLGALTLWVDVLATRRRARRAEYAQRLLEAQVQELMARLGTPPLPPPRMTGLIVALDTADVAQARRWADAVAPSCGMIKLGLEFFLANGPEGVRAFGDWPVFLDLKLHDIPNTVARAVRALLPLRPRLLTLHAAGEANMIKAARAAAEAAGDARPGLLVVTVLTSLESTLSEVLLRAEMAMAAGADGLVCSGHEVHTLRELLGEDAVLVVPGIRPPGSTADDQARTTTPRAAAAAGADWLVVGRPITAAPDPAAAAAAIAAEIAG